MMTSLELGISTQLSIVEYKALYEIGRVIIRVQDAEAGLREIVRLARPAFIFDNIVLYEEQKYESLEPTYARSVGRGRSAEADLEWGEKIAREVLRTNDVVITREQLEGRQGIVTDTRLNLRYYLGLPLDKGDGQPKALVFIRFGGPPYLEEQIEFAKLIAVHVEELLIRQNLLERIAALEAERRFNRFQENFVATVSHELRSPLGFIKGYATTLMRDDTEWDLQTRREFLSIIDEEADRLSALIDNMLDSSRLQSGTMPIEFQEVRLNSVLKGFIQRMKAGKSDLTVKLVTNDSVNTVWADPGRLVQVFDNLVMNAVKYAPGSELTISLNWESEQAHIVFSDSGPGIPQEHLEDIFKRFYRLPQHQNNASGTGLGLYICDEIIQAHKGRIFAESKIGQGAEFHIYLPRMKNLQEQKHES